MEPVIKPPYIDISLLKDGYLYQIKARNTSIGIWLEEENGFLYSRTKFAQNFLDIEYHWDFHFGTAKPIKEICKTPFEEINTLRETSRDIILDYLNQPKKKLSEQNLLHISEIEKELKGE